MDNRYFITGATGYIGSMLAKKLISDGEEVDVVARNPSRLDRGILSHAGVIQADVTDREAIFRITEKYSYVIHCAAPTASFYMALNPVEVTKAIVNGTEHILNLAERCKKRCVPVLHGGLWADCTPEWEPGDGK